MAALCAAIEFGVQPELFYKTSASGAHVPLYAVPLVAVHSEDAGALPGRGSGRLRADRQGDRASEVGERPGVAGQPRQIVETDDDLTPVDATRVSAGS
jgi:hypothetical protein